MMNKLNIFGYEGNKVGLTQMEQVERDRQESTYND